MHFRALLIQVALAAQPLAAYAQTEPLPAPNKTGSPDVTPKNEVASEVKKEGTQAAVAAPDLVRLKNGSMLRGTIGELVANDHVTVITVTGETRRFSLAEVTYAGPASEAPAPAAIVTPAAAPAKSDAAARHGGNMKPDVASGAEAGKARLRLSANSPNVTFYMNTGQVRGGFTGYVSGSWHRPDELMFGEISSRYYKRLCTAPCTATLPEGRHDLALGVDDDIVSSENKLDLRGDMDIRGEYVDKSSWRTAGIFVFGGSMVAGLVMMLLDRGAGGAIWITGAGIALAGGVTGGIMLAQSDRALLSSTGSTKR